MASTKNKRDYYEVLGLNKNSTQDEIKRAFRKGAMKWHPDRNKSPEAVGKFKELNEAYMVLSDADKREKYDRFGFNGLDFGEGGGFSGGGFSSFSDIMDMFFGGGFGGGFGGSGEGARRRRRVRGEDIEIPVKLTFLEAVFGVKKDIKYKRYEPCPTCEGTGGTDVKTCPKCHGTGQETRTTRTILGMMQQVTTCSQCNGEGTIVKNPCPACGGRKVVSKEHKTTVTIPAGVDSNMSLKMHGQGQIPSKDAIPGDLYITIRVKPDKRFERDGNDINSSVVISIIDAIKGTEVEIPTVDGPTKIKIPAGTQPESILRLRNKGIPTLNSKGQRRGHHFVTIKINIPKYSNFTKVQKTTFDQLAKSLKKK
ncbi:MAG: molecular chaperone DnaJ [Promethearchaeota archaeon]